MKTSLCVGVLLCVAPGAFAGEEKAEALQQRVLVELFTSHG